MFLMIFLSVLKKSALCCPETGEVPTETKLLLKKDKAVILKQKCVPIPSHQYLCQQK